MDLEREEDIRASLPRLLGWLRDVMPSGDQRKRYEDHLGDYIDGKKPVDRAVVRQAHRDAITAGDKKYANVREYRGQIIIATIVLGVLLVAVAIWHALNPHFISLCAKSQGELVCVAGKAEAAADIFEVLAVGAIGGALSIAFSLSRTTTAPPRSDPRRAQRALKPVAGAATALIGVILIQTEILIAAPTTKESVSLALGYAALFGFSQQLFTQFVDKRGKQLLTEQTESSSDTTNP